MAFEDLKKEAEDRGYWASDMEKTKREVTQDWREWKKSFQGILRTLLGDGDRGPNVVKQAARLADAEVDMLKSRKPVGLEDAD